MFKRDLRKFVVGWVVFCGFLSIQAQEAPLKTTAEVLEAFIAANGGQENIDSIISIRAIGKVEREDGSPVEIVVVRKRPDLKRISTVIDGVTVHRGFDGEKSWMMVERDGVQLKVEELVGDDKVRFESDPYHLDLLFFPAEGNLVHELKGVEYVGRVPCYVMESRLGEKRRVAYVDSRSFRVPKVVEFSTKPDGSELRSEQVLSDYTKVHKIWIARRVVRTDSDGETMTIVFEKLEINHGIFDYVFAMPTIE